MNGKISNARRLLCLTAAVAAATLWMGLSQAPGEARQSEEKRYLYVGRAPKDRDGFRDLAPSIEVHDIDDNHKLVKVIPLPSGVFNLRGMCASAATKRLYLSHYGVFKGHPDPAKGGGKLLCLDLETGKVLWEKGYPPSADRMAITPDGGKIYFPAGEERKETFWTVLDARTGAVMTTIPLHAKPHNTICSLDGKHAFLQAFGQEEQRLTRPGTREPMPDENPNDEMTHENGFLAPEERSIAVVDTGTDKVVRKIGPFRERTRPFTINGKGTLVFVTLNDLIGFQVGDAETGKVLHTAAAPEPYTQPEATRNQTFAHGIALTANEKEVWVVDQKYIGLHVFDVSGLPHRPPVWKQFVKTRTGRPDIFGQPGWIMASIDGRYLYPETCEIVDTQAKKVVGQLVGANGKPTHSRFALEVDFRDGVPIRVGDQFGVGRITNQ